MSKLGPVGQVGLMRAPALDGHDLTLQWQWTSFDVAWTAF